MGGKWETSATQVGDKRSQVADKVKIMRRDHPKSSGRQVGGLVMGDRWETSGDKWEIDVKSCTRSIAETSGRQS